MSTTTSSHNSCTIADCQMQRSGCCLLVHKFCFIQVVVSRRPLMALFAKVAADFSNFQILFSKKSGEKFPVPDGTKTAVQPEAVRPSSTEVLHPIISMDYPPKAISGSFYQEYVNYNRYPARTSSQSLSHHCAQPDFQPGNSLKGCKQALPEPILRPGLSAPQLF